MNLHKIHRQHIKRIMITTTVGGILLSGSLLRAAGPEFFAKVNSLSEAGKKAEAIQLLQKEIQETKDNDDKGLVPFSLAVLLYKTGDYEKAIAAFDKTLKEQKSLADYAYYYRGMSRYKLDQLDLAQDDFKKILESSGVNSKLQIESTLMLGQISLRRERFKDAKAYFQKNEKRVRGSEDYPELIYSLALTEQGLGNHRNMCKWATKLYSRYPTFGKIQEWGFDLAENKLGQKPTHCSSDLDDFRTRVRYLIFAGYDKKAQLEITGIRERLVKTDPYLADQVQAQYFAQEGELTKAFELLKPYYEQKKNSFGYLMAFASVAARAGEVQAAVGSYYSAYKMSPHQKQAKEALYQSAFLSYQFQDYDGAGRRFKEFMQVYPKSALIRDAKWQLAWLKYLKGDYTGAYKAFNSLQNEKDKRGRRGRGKYPVDRLNYWMAMSLFRQGKYDQARVLFEGLTKDSLMGYYAIAAQYRLKKIQTIQPRVANRVYPETSLRWISRMPASEFMMPMVDDSMILTTALPSETEESMVIQDLANEAADSESNETAEVSENKQVDVVEGGTEVPQDSERVVSPELVRRFEKARDLMTIGLEEWAKWDLYDIERKTRNKDFMKALMSEYNMIGYFHRSSYIGQVYFSSQRSSFGLEGTRPLWEYAYPKAYSKSVEKYAGTFSVPQELVWGIMRAESQYRRDAISPVGALGLMQVMPFTGYRVASLLGEKDFQPRQLLESDAAIKMGARYLQRLMVKFDNTIPLVAAGYNAGPHRVKNWLASFGHLETDEFIEHIPFLETRNYVKKVVSNCHVYAKLYSNKKDLFAYLVDPVPFKTDGQTVQKESWDDI